MKAKVWIDILSPKQILFFQPVIRSLQSKGCEVLATSRRYRELEPLAKLHGLDLLYIGERGGGSQLEQLVAATRRQEEIIPIVSGFRPTVSMSVASGVCARVSFGLGVKHLAVNDSPHSLVAGKLAIPLSRGLLCPWIIPPTAWRVFGIGRSQITTYRALDPAAWLKRKALAGPLPRLDRRKKTITVRLEESYAPYMAGTDRSWNDTVLAAIAEGFGRCNLVALCRYEDQLAHVRAQFGGSFLVPEEVVDGRSLLAATDLFIGMGGTMSAEAALMGVPTISTFQGTLYTERYLSSVGLLRKTRGVGHLVAEARKLLRKGTKEASSRKASRILASMEDPVPVVVRAIENA